MTLSKKAPVFIAILLLSILPLFLFAALPRYEFVNWDDPDYVTQNTTIRSLSVENLLSWFTRPVLSLYVPITLFSYALDYQIHGSSPGGYHLTNLGLHILNMVLVFFILMALFKDPAAAILGSFVFGFHPAQVQPVAWISERKTLLFSVFILSAFFMLLRRKKEGSEPSGGPVIILLFILGVLSKITAAVFPLILWAASFFFAADSKELRRRSGLLSALATFFVAATLLLYPRIMAALFQNLFEHGYFMPWVRMLRYFLHAFFPYSLNLFYGTADYEFLHAPRALAAAVIASLSLFAFVFMAARTKKLYAFGFIWFLLWLLPVCIFRVPVSDHHLYLPLLGLIIMIIDIFNFRKLALYAVLGLSVSGSALLAYQRVPVWTNSETLWRSVLDKQPDDYRALLHLADHYQSTGSAQEALTHYEHLMRQYPKEAYAYTNLINLHLSLRQIPQAASVLQRFEQHLPGHPDVWSLRAAIAYASGQREEAVKLLNQALEADADNAAALLNLARIYFAGNDLSQAAPLFERLVKIQPGMTEALYFLGMAYNGLGQYDKSLATFDRLVSKNILLPGLYFQKGFAHYKLVQLESAEQAYRKSTQLEPNLAEAYFHLGLIRYQQKDLTGALLWIEKALKIKPGHVPYQQALSKIKNETA